MDHVSRLPPWYVTGLIEAQGSFVANASPRRIEVSFELALPGDDRSLLAALQACFDGAGRIRPRPRAGGATWRVTRRLELLRVVEHLEAYPLQGLRAEALRPWAALVRQRAGAFRKPPPPEAWDLVEVLRSAQPRRRGRHASRRRRKSKTAVDEPPSEP